MRWLIFLFSVLLLGAVFWARTVPFDSILTPDVQNLLERALVGFYQRTGTPPPFAAFLEEHLGACTYAPRRGFFVDITQVQDVIKQPFPFGQNVPVPPQLAIACLNGQAKGSFVITSTDTAPAQIQILRSWHRPIQFGLDSGTVDITSEALMVGFHYSGRTLWIHSQKKVKANFSLEESQHWRLDALEGSLEIEYVDTPNGPGVAGLVDLFASEIGEITFRGKKVATANTSASLYPSGITEKNPQTQ